MTDIDFEDGSWEDARVDMVPERVGALSVSQLEPEVLAAEEEAVADCRRGRVVRWGWKDLDVGSAENVSDRTGGFGFTRNTLL